MLQRIWILWNWFILIIILGKDFCNEKSIKKFYNLEKNQYTKISNN